MEKATAQEICQAIKAYFRYNDTPLTEVAQKIDTTYRAVQAQLAGRPFSRKAAERYAEAFGFDVNYLLTGTGSLFSNHEHITIDEAPASSDLSNLIQVVKSQQETIAALVNKLP